MSTDVYNNPAELHICRRCGLLAELLLDAETRSADWLAVELPLLKANGKCVQFQKYGGKKSPVVRNQLPVSDFGFRSPAPHLPLSRCLLCADGRAS